MVVFSLALQVITAISLAVIAVQFWRLIFNMLDIQREAK